MEMRKIQFDQIEWQSPQPGARFRVFRDGSKQVRLLELSREFEETEWCEKGHIGLVLSGAVDINFSGHIDRFPEGTGLWIPAGAAHAHKARAVTPIVRLFLVEEVSS